MRRATGSWFERTIPGRGAAAAHRRWRLGDGAARLAAGAVGSRAEGEGVDALVLFGVDLLEEVDDVFFARAARDLEGRAAAAVHGARVEFDLDDEAYSCRPRRDASNVVTPAVLLATVGVGAALAWLRAKRGKGGKVSLTWSTPTPT